MGVFIYNEGERRAQSEPINDMYDAVKRMTERDRGILLSRIDAMKDGVKTLHKNLRSGVSELKLHDGMRVYYTEIGDPEHGGHVVLLNASKDKDNSRAQDKAIEDAIKYREDLLKRMAEERKHAASEPHGKEGPAKVSDETILKKLLRPINPASMAESLSNGRERSGSQERKQQNKQQQQQGLHTPTDAERATQIAQQEEQRARQASSGANHKGSQEHHQQQQQLLPTPEGDRIIAQAQQQGGTTAPTEPALTGAQKPATPGPKAHDAPHTPAPIKGEALHVTPGKAAGAAGIGSAVVGVTAGVEAYANGATPAQAANKGLEAAIPGQEAWNLALAGKYREAAISGAGALGCIAEGGAAGALGGFLGSAVGPAGTLAGGIAGGAAGCIDGNERLQKIAASLMNRVSGGREATKDPMQLTPSPATQAPAAQSINPQLRH